MSGRLIAIVGPSGVGKDSVMRELAASDPRLGLVERVITRDAALGGEDFIAVSEEDFASRKARGEFALDWAAHGLLYGIPKAIEPELNQGRDLLVNLSRAILPKAQQAFPSLITFLVTASDETLRIRLKARGRESAQDIQDRLARAKIAMPEGVEFRELSNDGHLTDTVQAAVSMLYPEDALT